MKFEVCAPNLPSALAAQRAGAHRIELCSALDVGGVTPSMGLIRAAKQALDIEVHVLIRPREGGFCYTEAEFELMLYDVRSCRETGAAGVVVGALTADGQLDLARMQALKEAAGPLQTTCHRAFDFSPDPREALEQLIGMGFSRVLSSGQAATAYEGRALLQTLVAQAQGRMVVMLGAGISAQNIREIAVSTGASEFHFTAKKCVQPTENQTNIIPGLDTRYWESDEELIRQTMLAAKGLKSSNP